MLRTRIPVTPHRLLNPNATITRKERDQLPWPLPMKSSTIIKFALRRQLREATMLAALNDRPEKPLSGKVVLRFTVAYEKGRKALDWDNCVSSCKGLIDGLVDAGFMRDDDQVTGIFLTQTKDPEGKGYVDVVVEPEKGAKAA